MEKDKRCSHPHWKTEVLGYNPHTEHNKTDDFIPVKYIQTCEKCGIIRVVKVR